MLRHVVGENKSHDVPSRRLPARNKLVCPDRMEDRTHGNAFYWSCGSGCPGGFWTDACCACACAPKDVQLPECKPDVAKRNAAEYSTNIPLISEPTQITSATSGADAALDSQRHVARANSQNPP